MDFISIIAELKNGMVAGQAGECFSELVAAVKEHGQRWALGCVIRS